MYVFTLFNYILSDVLGIGLLLSLYALIMEIVYKTFDKERSTSLGTLT